MNIVVNFLTSAINLSVIFDLRIFLTIFEKKKMNYIQLTFGSLNALITFSWLYNFTNHTQLIRLIINYEFMNWLIRLYWSFSNRCINANERVVVSFPWLQSEILYCNLLTRLNQQNHAKPSHWAFLSVSLSHRWIKSFKILTWKMFTTLSRKYWWLLEMLNTLNPTRNSGLFHYDSSEFSPTRDTLVKNIH